MNRMIRKWRGTGQQGAGPSQCMHVRSSPFAVAATGLVIALLAACSTTRQREGEISDRERYWHYAKEEVPSISAFGRMNGWRPLGRNELVVWTGFDDAYILRVSPPCHELDTAIGIRLESRVGSTISSGFDWLRVGRDRCRILSIHPVDYKLMKQEERELRQEAKKEGS